MTPHPIIKALEEYEKSEGGSAPRPQVFAFRNPWLVRDFWLQGRVPGYSHADCLRSMLGGFLGKKMAIASHAAAIQIKHDMTRIRAFYLPARDGGSQGNCLKIVQADGATGIRMRQELELRTVLAKMGTAHIPQISSSFERAGFIYLIEEIIIGRRFSIGRDTQAYITQGLPQMLATYKKFGIRSAPLSAHFEPSLLTRLREVPRVDAALLAAVEKAFSRDTDIPVSLCHGDLLPSNMCIGADKFYLLDWDRSFEGAIVLDLLRLPLLNIRRTVAGLRRPC
ncbi:MAG: phosphotransferase [Alphaproteobacteria bacterium]|nr:phosphotransferase [Alphaproteobacteria bacterium]